MLLSSLCCAVLVSVPIMSKALVVSAALRVYWTQEESMR